MEFNYVAPEMIYVCPMTGEKFYSYKKYCLGCNPPCLYFNSIKKDGYGDIVLFDVIVCEFPQSSASKARKQDE